MAPSSSHHLTLLLAYLAFCLARASSLFPQQTFKSSGLQDVGSLGLGDVDGMIIALGDSNGDQFQDVFVLSANQRSLSLYLWDRASATYTPVSSNPVIAEAVGNFVITNVVAVDVDHDGRLDVLLMGSQNPSDPSQEEVKMEVWYGINGASFKPGQPVVSASRGQPIIFDSQGEMMVDLLGVPIGSTVPGVWLNQAKKSNVTSGFEIDYSRLQGNPCLLSSPHSHTFVDLDGDCLADLFLTCENPDGSQRYQIWTNAKSSGYVLTREADFHKGVQSVSFADMDRDGTLDMVFAACPSPSSCTINVAYNLQMPLCGNTNGTACRDSRNLCVADPNFYFTFDPSSGAFTSVPLTDIISGQNLVTRLSTSMFSGEAPLPLQIGDYNLDGYPDLLFLTSPQSFSATTQWSVRLLESQLCDKTSCSPKDLLHHRRTFRLVDKHTEALEGIKDARSAFFMDVGEDGTLDIVVQRAGSGTGASRSISIIKNNYFNDAFFMKAMVLNGACQTWCYLDNGVERFKPYGVNYPGASYKFIIQDTGGVRRAAAVGQFAYSSYASVGTPYCYFGLGRTNNYVENFFVGSTRHQPEHFINIEGLIPNSQMVIIPFQPTGTENPTTWTRELYLHPGDWIPSVTVTLIVTTAVLGMTVLVLHVNEKREDELERRRKAHTINFDAL